MKTGRAKLRTCTVVAKIDLNSSLINVAFFLVTNFVEGGTRRAAHTLLTLLLGSGGGRFNLTEDN